MLAHGRECGNRRRGLENLRGVAGKFAARARGFAAPGTLRRGLSFAPSASVHPVVSSPILLTALDAGTSARLHSAHVDAGTRSLLRSLGLTDACELRVCQSGDPLVVQVRATSLGLSHAVARQLWVVPDASTQAASDADNLPPR